LPRHLNFTFQADGADMKVIDTLPHFPLGITALQINADVMFSNWGTKATPIKIPSQCDYLGKAFYDLLHLSPPSPPGTIIKPGQSVTTAPPDPITSLFPG